MILGDGTALDVGDHVIHGSLDHRGIVSNGEQIGQLGNLSGVILLMDALQHGVDLVQTGGGAQMHTGVQEGILLLGVDLGALQRLQDAHGDLVVVGEDPLGGGDVLNSAGIQPVDEQLLALAAAPAGVVGGLDGSDLLLGPAILLQHAEEAVVTHGGNGRVVTGHDEDLVAGLHAVGDEALGGLGADAVVIALDAGNSSGSSGVDDTVEHHIGDAAGGQLGHGVLQGVVLRQNDHIVSGLVLDQVLHLLDLVGGVGRGDDGGGILAGVIQLLRLLLRIGHHSAGPAVVGIGDQDRDAITRGSIVVLVGVIVLLLAASDKRQGHDQRKDQCQYFLHGCFLLKIFYRYGQSPPITCSYSSTQAESLAAESMTA